MKADLLYITIMDDYMEGDYEDDGMVWDVFFHDGIRNPRKTTIDIKTHAKGFFFASEKISHAGGSVELGAGDDVNIDEAKAIADELDPAKNPGITEDDIVFSIADVKREVSEVFPSDDVFTDEEMISQSNHSFNMLGYKKGESRDLKRQVMAYSVINNGDGNEQQESSAEEASTLCIKMIDEIEINGSQVYGLQFCSTTEEFDQASMPDRATKYCLSLLRCQFYGQTGQSDRDAEESLEPFHLGSGLRMMDECLRSRDPRNIDPDNLYIEILRKIAPLRRRENESEADCHARFEIESKRFLNIYRNRADNPQLKEWKGHSQPMGKHRDYWGTRQQLMAGKVIADWVDRKNGPLDPVFGVLLNPSGGRAGKGDSCLLHHFLYDKEGKYAYHSAVHDSFGYLKVIHNEGPGYNYINRSLLASISPLAGQYYGIKFWRDALEQFPLRPTLMEFASHFGGALFSKNNAIRWY